MTTYAVKNRHGFVRFIEARTEAQAIRHCAKGEFSASIPTLAEAIEFGRNGGTVEVAGSEMQAEPADIAAVNAVVGVALPIETE